MALRDWSSISRTPIDKRKPDGPQYEDALFDDDSNQIHLNLSRVAKLKKTSTGAILKIVIEALDGV